MPVAFIAGATSFTGRAIAHQDAAKHGVELRLQVRPGSRNTSALGDDNRIVRVSLDEPDALSESMRGCDAVVQLIGTIKDRFSVDGDYEKVDYNTTVQLLAAAKTAGVKHFLLLSSVGAGVGVGSYLAWKKKTEQKVIESGIGYSLVRPSAFAGDDKFTERKALTNTQAFMSGLTDTPFGAAFATLRPMPIQGLARIFLELVKRGPQQKALSGAALFQIIRESDDDAAS